MPSMELIRADKGFYAGCSLLRPVCVQVSRFFRGWLCFSFSLNSRVFIASGEASRRSTLTHRCSWRLRFRTRLGRHHARAQAGGGVPARNGLSDPEVRESLNGSICRTDSGWGQLKIFSDMLVDGRVRAVDARIAGADAQCQMNKTPTAL